MLITSIAVTALIILMVAAHITVAKRQEKEGVYLVRVLTGRCAVHRGQIRRAIWSSEAMAYSIAGTTIWFEESEVEVIRKLL